MKLNTVFKVEIGLLTLGCHALAFLSPAHRAANYQNGLQYHNLPLKLSSQSPSTGQYNYEEGTKVLDEKKISADWELDCYSRPVIDENGKKMWELLLTDSGGGFQHVQRLPSNAVNSREVRKIVQGVIDDSPVKPKVIRFFRSQMQNMIQIALGEMATVVAKPSRRTYRLFDWLDNRERELYPKMPGYKPSMEAVSSTPTFVDFSVPEPLPDTLRAESYAFVSLPLEEMLTGGSINKDNIGDGKMCPMDNFEARRDEYKGEMVQGIVFLTGRATALATFMKGIELSYVKANLRKRQMLLEVDINRQFIMARLTDKQRAEAEAFERGKARLNGLHFLCVQTGAPEDEDAPPAGFWLLREKNL